MNKTLNHWLLAGALVVVALPFASPAKAQAVACGIYRTGLIALLADVRPAPCSYQGDYIVQLGPVYSGPAVIAPQPTYSPSPTMAGYVRGPYRAGPVRRVSVKNELPEGKGKVEIVQARAEVRIYGSERMEILLYRR